MSEATARQFNMYSLSVPRAFFGKKRDVELGSGNFVPKNGEERLKGSTILSLSLLHTGNVMFGGFNLMPYSTFTDALNFSRPTVCSNLKELTDNDVIERKRQSKYEIKAEFSDSKALPVYSFFLKEKLDFGKGARKLAPNEILYISEIIAFYLNDKNKGKHFIGGRKRAAKALKAPESTAGSVVYRLKKMGAIYVKSMIIDSAGNEVVTNGKGSSKKELTVYEVNSQILRRCRAIEKLKEEMRKAKELFGSDSDNKVNKERKANKQGYTYNKYIFAENFQDNPSYKKLSVIFASDETVINLKERYKRLENKFLESLFSGNAGLTDKLEEEMADVEEELYEYLIRKGIPPSEIPKNLIEYIKN